MKSGLDAMPLFLLDDLLRGKGSKIKEDKTMDNILNKTVEAPSPTLPS